VRLVYFVVKNKMTAAAIKHLSAADPVMRKLIAEIGACKLEPETKRAPFQ
jgi:hypothetical protein